MVNPDSFVHHHHQPKQKETKPLVEKEPRNGFQQGEPRLGLPQLDPLLLNLLLHRRQPQLLSGKQTLQQQLFHALLRQANVKNGEVKKILTQMCFG